MAAWTSLFTTLISLGLAVQVGGQYAQRHKPHQLVWSLALFMFAIGAGCQFAATGLGDWTGLGWTNFSYRLWYLTGAILTAAYLGQGTAYLQMKRRTAHLLMGALAAASVLGAVMVFTAPVDLKLALSGLSVSGAGMPQAVRLLTPFFNIYGTVMLAGGAIKSSWYFLWSGGSTTRALGTALVAVGAIIVAAGGTLTRFSVPEALYLSELMGVLLLFAGFTLSNQPMRGLWLSMEQLAVRRKQVTRWGVGAGVSFLFGALLLLPILPWTMGIVTDAKHVYTNQVPEENRGTYLVTRKGAMQLYNWYIQPPEFPGDAPTLDSADIESIEIVQKQFSPVSDYRLFRLAEGDETGGQEAPLVETSRRTMHLVLSPGAALQTGRYMLIVPMDSMFGGSTLHFFELQ